MLGLKVAAPLYGIYELFTRLLKKLDRFGVGYGTEIMADKLFKPCNKSLFKMCVEELHFVRALVKYRADNGLYHILGNLDNIGQLGKGYLGLNMPELCKVLGCI